MRMRGDRQQMIGRVSAHLPAEVTAAAVGVEHGSVEELDPLAVDSESARVDRHATQARQRFARSSSHIGQKPKDPATTVHSGGVERRADPDIGVANAYL